LAYDRRLGRDPHFGLNCVSRLSGENSVADVLDSLGSRSKSRNSAGVATVQGGYYSPSGHTDRNEYQSTNSCRP
jgi:hypothetical protein